MYTRRDKVEKEGIRLRTTRLYKSESETRVAIPNYGRRWRNPYDYEY